MILYVNGDSHSAGAEAVLPYCFAEDDPLYRGLGRQPHPDNLKVSYGCELANHFFAILDCDAESASSNDRILRTTKEYISSHKPDALVIGWSTWEREEWLHNGTYYQVTGSGTDSVPADLRDKYKDWVINTTNTVAENELRWHDEIYRFHLELDQLEVPHLFFNTYRYFGHIKQNNLLRYDWGDNYVNPYDQDYTYYYWLQNNGFRTVNSKSYHFGAKAHTKWADFLLPYLTKLL
jgi:hypothetical protein